MRKRLMCLLMVMVLVFSSTSVIMASESEDTDAVTEEASQSTTEEEPTRLGTEEEPVQPETEEEPIQAEIGEEPTQPGAGEEPTQPETGDELIDLSEASVTLSKATYTYNGKAKKPTVSVTLDDVTLSAEQYDVAYSDNINAGTATVTITGKGAYTGTVIKTFTIKKAENSISQKTKYGKTYSTKKQTIQLAKTAKYEKAKLTYKASNSKIKVSSTGLVTIPAKFSGKFTITITSKATKNYASGAKVKVTVYVPTATTLSSVKKASATSIKVSWKKSSVATGYQIQYATNSKFSSKKSVSITKQATVSKTIKSLKRGKTYYVRVRAYKTVNGTKYYGKWSSVLKLKLPAASSSSKKPSSGTVYWVPSGSVYHNSKNCPSLSRSRTIYSGTIQESGKSRACKVCS